MSAQIPLFRRDGAIVGYALVDQIDYGWLSERRWHRDNKGYVRASASREGGTRVLMHRLILGLTDPDIHGDHINGDRADNRRCNLRAVERWANSQNRAKNPSHNTSGFRGVSWHREKRKWKATCTIRGRKYHLGSFEQKADAAAAAAAFRAQHMPYSADARVAAMAD